MVRPKLDAHYSVLGLISRVAFCLGLSLLLWFVAAHLMRQNWVAMTNYVAAAVLAGAALSFFFCLLTPKGQGVPSRGANGVNDPPLTPPGLPWHVVPTLAP